MINLVCPNCSAALEIDDGFRGGICRCFSCGTLMTVPADPRRDEAERLEARGRPERPGEPGEQRPAEPTTYEKADGTTVTVTEEKLRRIPVARKRRYGVRAAVIVAFVVIMGGLVAAVAYGLKEVLETPAPPSAAEASPENPFLMDQPNFLSLPLADRTVVMADTSRAMADHLELVKAALAAGARSLASGQALQVVLWAEDEPLVYPAGGPAGPGDFSPAALRRMLEQVYPSGGLHAVDAFERALRARPDRIILATAMAPLADQLDVLKQRASEAEVTVDVVALAPAARAMGELADATGGRYLELSAGQLAAWYDAYRSAEPAEADRADPPPAEKQEQEEEEDDDAAGPLPPWQQ